MSTLITLESNALRVVIAPEYGARLVNLLDRAAGREWLTQGGYSMQTGEDARYGSAEAVGWDECFPTVSPCEAQHTVWKRRLRDHGDIWGRPWTIDNLTATSASLHFRAAAFTFSRRTDIVGTQLRIGYAVTNHTTSPLPYLWALHALFAVDSGDRVELPGMGAARPTYLSTHSDAKVVGPLPWDTPNRAVPFRLADVQPRSSGFAAKFLASAAGGGARIGRPGSWLDMSWDEQVPAVGIWLTYGGWPGPGGHQEIAVEPTSAQADDLNEAIAAGAPPIPAGGTAQWSVRMTVSQ